MRRIPWLALLVVLVASPVRADEKKELKALVDKVSRANGGDKMAALKAWSLKQKVTVTDGVVLVQTMFWQPPDRGRIEVERREKGATKKIVSVTDGRRRWQQIDGKDQDLKKEDGAGWADGIRFMGPGQVLRLKDARHKLALLAETKVGGRPVVGIQVTYPANAKRTSKWFFDKETGLLVREEFDWEPKGKKQKVEFLFTDYKTVAGIPVARKRTGKLDGKGRSKTEILEFKAHEKLDEKLFRKP